MSSTFEKFKNSFFEYSSREGPALEVLDELNENERKKAVEILISSLTAEKIYFIQALGYLRSPKAFTPLVEMLPKAKGLSKVYIAEALWRIQRYEPALLVLCQAVKKRGIFGSSAAVRREAAIALGGVDDRRSIKALSIALTDKNYLVQYHAQKSLAVLLGMQEEINTFDQAMNGPYSERQSAYKEFRKRIENELDNYLE